MSIVQGTVNPGFIQALIEAYSNDSEAHKITVETTKDNHIRDDIWMYHGDLELETGVGGTSGAKGTGYTIEFERGEEVTVNKITLTEDDNMGVGEIATFDGLDEHFPYGGDFEVGSIKIKFE